MNSLIRRTAPVTYSASQRALSLLLSPACSPLPPPLPALGSPSVAFSGLFHVVDYAGKLSFCGWRAFHFAAGPLGFRATDVARAEYAVDELYEDVAKQGADEGLEIAKLGISKDIMDKLARKGITKLFPIQRAVLEPAMQGRDMIGRARTGTGKTLAFGIPIIDNIIRFQKTHGRGRNPLAIVLAPTRELARQVEKEFAESSSLDTICVYGGTPINQQMRALNYGVDIVVGTPGRIIDLMNRGALNLSEIQFVVLDEADQMLAVGFAEDVEKILEKLPPNRQSMMFSATMPSWIRSLTRKFLKDPVTIDLVGDSDQKLADGITLYSIVTDNYAKPSILGPLIKEHAKGGKCIVFTQTKRDADRLTYSMGRSFGCEALHGDISQNQRERTLAGFRDGRFNILIATDVAARGLDIPNVDLVIHYELPNTSELFVHRSGRTGRAGKKGSAILIHTHEQRRVVRGIEQDVGSKFVELPNITVESGNEDMFGGRFDSRGRGPGSGYREDFGGSSFGRSRGFGSPGSFGDPPGRSGGYGESSSGRFGSFGQSTSGSSSGFGRFASGRSGGFGKSGFGNSSGSISNHSDGSGETGFFGSFRDSNSGRFGGFGKSGYGKSSGSASDLFGDFSSSKSASPGFYDNSSTGRFRGRGDSVNFREDSD